MNFYIHNLNQVAYPTNYDLSVSYNSGSTTLCDNEHNTMEDANKTKYITPQKYTIYYHSTIMIPRRVIEISRSK